MTQKKFQKKWPNDEWFEVAKKQSGRRFTIANSKRTVMVSIGNYKKWMSVKYYGHHDKEKAV